MSQGPAGSSTTYEDGRRPAGSNAPPETADWPTEGFVTVRRFGDATVTVVSDGGFTWAPQLSAPEADWRKAMPEANAAGEVMLGHNMALIQLGGAAILVDAGLDDPGPDSSWMPPRAVRSPGVEAGLARAGIRAEDVTHVALTHVHGDHIAGATVIRNGERVPRYPNARYLLSRRDWEGNVARTQPDSLVSVHLGLLERLGQLDVFDGEHEIVPGVSLVPAPGDSPGHHVVHLTSGGQHFYATGDLFHHACEVAHTDWVSPGRDPMSSKASRERFLKEATANGATIVFSHEPFPPWGRFVSDGDAADAAGATGTKAGSYRWERFEPPSQVASTT